MYERLKQRGIHHVCLRVPDLYQAADFYVNGLGARIVCEWGKDENEDHAYILDLGEGDFLEVFGCSKHFELGLWQHVAVWTDDIHASFERALAHGGTRMTEVMRSDIPTRSGQIVRMYYGFVRAPGGEEVEFIQHIPDPEE